jgi:hypothetical protein
MIPKHVYVDESFVPNNDLLIAGLVFSPIDLATGVDSVLVKHGFVPGHDEFKSTNRFREEPRWSLVRDGLLRLLHDSDVRIAAIVGSYRNDYRHLGNVVFSMLLQVAQHGGFNAGNLIVELDRDLRRDDARLAMQKRDAGPESVPQMNFGADSKLVGGVQVADLIAGSVRTILVEHLHNNPATVVFGEAEGYDPGTEIILSEEILMHLAWSFYADALQPDEYGTQNVWTAFPAGALITESTSPDVRRAAKERLGSLWRGCAH